MEFVATNNVAAVARAREIAANTYEVEITPEVALAPFTPGQFLSVRIAHLDNDPAGRSRDFSLSSGPGDPLRVAVRGSDSPYKRALLADGPVDVEVAGPYGFFVLPETTEAQVVGIAGGIGVTPLVSMARYLTGTKSEQAMTILTIDSAEARIAYRPELAKLAAINPRLRVVHRVGRVDSHEALAELLPELKSESLAYLVGPPPMTGPMRQIVRSFGLMPLAIMQEEFAGYISADD
jgi:ferredoxin-NADP reductase